jgi:hypothetical protein
MKYWEIIVDNLKKAGWSLATFQLGREGRTIWIVDAHLGKLLATSPSPSNPFASLFVIAIDSVIGPLANESEHCCHYVR